MSYGRDSVIMNIKLTSKIKKYAAYILSVFLLVGVLSVNTLPVSAAPGVHYNYRGMPKYHSSVNGSLQYIETYGMESYATKDTFDLEQFLIDNPDLVDASITDRDAVWEWIVEWDSICPRVLHSMDPEEEYYCRARNLCIQLGVYGATSTLSVKEKCKIIHDDVCKRSGYDYNYNNDTFQELMDANTGTCAGFTYYGNVMFTIAGIENGYVVGPNHMWNVVLDEDGNWYQIDMCWDCTHGYKTDYFWMTERCNVAARNISSSGYFMIPESQDLFITQDLK